jgi:hypothetical protein
VLDSSYRIASSRLFRQQNYYTRIRTDKNDKYVWEITYSGPVTKGDLQPSTIYTQVDAKTAELISYNVYIPNENETGAKRAVNKEQAKALAEQLATAAAPDKFSNTKYSESDGEVVRPLDDGQNEEPVYSYFNYSRTYEDIEFNSNYIQMGVNTIIGKVTSFSYYWMDDVEFESPEGVIDIEQAKNAYLSQGKVVLGYNIITSYLYDKESSKDDMAVSSARKISMVYPNVVDREYRAVLAYNFIPISGMISAKTAKPLDYMGKEIEDDEELDGYTDIADNRRQREITLMYDAGVLPKGKEFRPDDIVSQKDYLAFMLVVLNSRYQPLDAQTDLENLYKLAEDLGIIEKSERDPDKELNRFETMKYLVRALGFGKLSQDASLFNVTFKDAKSIPRTYYGTVALASHFSLTDPNASSFNGAEKVTRAEAAMQIYRLMKAIKNK